jgi:D-alanyl-D-alanine carboxypeptidase
MTAVVAKEILPPETTILLSAEDLALEGHHPSFEPNDTLRLEEALYLLLISSDNSVAQAISRAVVTSAEFVSKMNEKAALLGMSSTHFSNPSGLNGNVSTANDLLRLAQYIDAFHPNLWHISRQPAITIITKAEKTIELKNTNILIGKIPGLLGGKTGYTPEAAGSLLLLFDVGSERLLSVVLGSPDRFGDSQKIISWYWGKHFQNNF